MSGRYTLERNAEDVEEGRLFVGEHTYGKLKLLYWPGRENGVAHVGKFCSIAAGVEIFLGGNHRTEWVSSYPFNGFGRWRGSRRITTQPTTNGDVRIGSDVWIGRGATIMSGITIGDGAAIAARALVAKDVEPYSIVGGNPARHLRYRFDAETIERLLEIRWWDWSNDEIAAAVPLLVDPNLSAFLEYADSKA